MSHYNYKPHPAADLFPMLTASELADLADSIKQQGLIEPIWLYDDPGHGRVVLDGRNRLEACKVAGVEPRVRVYTGDDPIGHVVALNKHRRHLNSGQWAMIALSLESMYANEAKKRLSHVGNQHASKKSAVADLPQLIAPDTHPDGGVGGSGGFGLVVDDLAGLVVDPLRGGRVAGVEP